jgi:U2-associated protein SR140
LKQPKKISVPKRAASKGSPAEHTMEVDNNDDVVMGNMDGANDEPTAPQEAVESAEAGITKETVDDIPEPKEDPPREAEIKDAPAPVEIPGETAAARARRMRPKAEDMFASDEE